ncbi:MAG: hypothetical protein HQ579_04270 [Candidatus Omnitrophica bacterium]|nr:hypothetical protein [Candidatus Omnitrophota bacterium]
MLEFKKIIEKRLIIILLLVSACAIFISCNKYWAPYDEGIVTVAAERFTQGEVLYRDFFIIMYPPGQVFMLSLLYKIFGVTLGVGRIYTGFVHIFIALLVYMMCYHLTRKKGISVICWLFALFSLAPRLGAIPSPIWPGIALGLFSVYLFMLYVKSEKRSLLLLCGLTCGLSAIFRHDIGIFAFISIFITLILFRKGLKPLIFFIMSFAVLPAAVFIYLFSKGALPDAFESLFLFPAIHQKTALINFPNMCFNPIMIFHKSLYFIKVNQYYIPIFIYLITAVLLIKKLILKRVFDEREIGLLALLLFGILTFNQVRIRTDPAHLLTVIFPSIVLFGYLMNVSICEKMTNRPARYIYNVCVFFVLFLFSLLLVKNMDKFIKNVFRKPLKKKIILTRFDRGSVYIPKEDQSIKDAVSYIKNNTENGERIYVGNSAHWKDDFGGSLLFYTLCERLPCTKFYELAPGLITQRKVQEEIKGSISEGDVKFIILQDVDLPNIAKSKIDIDKIILDNFIEQNYKLVKKYGKYGIYKKVN